MIGERLAELRKDRGWDQKDLAKELGVSFHTVSSYERNRSEPNHEMLVKIAELFDISADYLLGLTRYRDSYNRIGNLIEVPKNLTEDDKAQIIQFINFLEEKKK